MRKFNLIFATILCWAFLFVACKKETTPDNDNPDVYSVDIDSTLKSFYPKPTPTTNFEGIYAYGFDSNPLNIYCALILNLNWYDPASTYGIYWHFNNGDGNVLRDANGFIQGFDSGVKIDSTLAGDWTNSDGCLAIDYVANPSANKGNLAGKGDKYIVFRAFEYTNPALKYYGWLRVTVSANGRDVVVHSIGFQKNPNTSLKTGEL
ncbi:MAG: hypothetical protein KDD21_01165 [Bacteroidetes bacterium]|nr:hypothetical protein [Bacteroidota bacterium]